MSMSSSTAGKNIRLFLVDGSPLGLIAAEIMNRTIKILSFPRGLLPDALQRPEVFRTGVYLLVGSEPDNPMRPLVYIGESDDVAKRLKQHDSDEGKDFFDQVALIISKDENLTKSHVRYLESRMIDIVRRIGSATLKNGNQGSPVTLPEAEKSDMEDVLHQMQILLPVLGYSFFQERPKRSAIVSQFSTSIDVNAQMPQVRDIDGPTFELTFMNGLIQAEAYEVEGQFIVKGGARIRNPEQAAPSTSKTYHLRVKQAQEQGILAPILDQPDVMELTEDMAFKSPSGASDLVCGASTNGRLYWKVKGSGDSYDTWRKARVEEVANSIAMQEVSISPATAL